MACYKVNFLASSYMCTSYKCLHSPVFHLGIRNQCMDRRRF